MVRDPVQQFLSCYQERFQRALKREASELTLDELHSALVNYTEPGMSYGCSNEIARFIAPSSDERVNRGRLGCDEIRETKRRLAQCTITNVATWRNDLTIQCGSSSTGIPG